MPTSLIKNGDLQKGPLIRRARKDHLKQNERVEDFFPGDKCVESNGNFFSAVQHRNGGYYLEFVVGGGCASVLTNPDPI